MLGNAKHLANLLGQMFLTRLALIQLELAEARIKLCRLLVLSFFALIFGVLFFGVLTVLVVFLLKKFFVLETVLLSIATIYFALTIVCAYVIFFLAMRGPGLFATTRLELKKDYQMLQKSVQRNDIN